MKDKSRLFLLTGTYLLVAAFGVWMLTLPLLMEFMLGTVRGQATLMTIGFVLLVIAAIGLANVIRKF
jgi:hypothetical protein